MDPSANLTEQLDIAGEILDFVGKKDWDDITDEERQCMFNAANRLSELVVSLDGWFQSGGFLPKRWSKLIESLLFFE